MAADGAEEVAVHCAALVVEGLRAGVDEGVEPWEQLPARTALGLGVRG